MVKGILALGAARGIVLLATAASAQTVIGAKPAPASTPSGTATPAFIPSGGLGMAVLGARISPSGAVLFGSGLAGASRLSTGIYEVEFNRDVTQRTYTAASSIKTLPIDVEPRSGTATRVYIEFVTWPGTFADSPFDLTINCTN